MCGIAGIITHGGAEREWLVARLEALAAALKHRGPDDRGIWASANAVAGLAHVRLSILDLSAAGHQPMASCEGRYTITYNGEIYNFRELRAELEQQGVQFKTGTDTEVLLAMYHRHGVDCVQRLRGMFAFCIWDQQEQRAFLARDPLGIKPLYYSIAGHGSLVFASELKALRRSGLVGTEIDGTAVMAYFESGSVPEPLTLLKGIFCLRAGHWLQWSNGILQERCYWQIQFDERREAQMDHRQAVPLVREALMDSIRHHFVSDVPVGIFLSGGIDSTALVALAVEAGHRGFRTFSIGVDDPKLDESSVARETAAHFHTEHHELRLSGHTAEESFAEYLQCGDQPSIDGFNTYTVARFARSAGMKVVLSGLGGDELFGGYPSFSTVPRMARWHRKFHLASPLDAMLGVAMEKWGTTARVRRLGSMLQRPPGILSAYCSFRGVFSSHTARLLTKNYVPGLSADPQGGGDSSQSQDELDQVSELELSRYMRNQLLKDSDAMSMAHGLELRVPFVDRKLFESVARVPAALRLRSGKAMLLDAVPEIPPQVSNARKRGFSFPFEKWLQASWGREFAAVRQHMPIPNPTWYQLWSVFMLERWRKSL